MSYEGYKVYYCKNGHLIGSWDVYDCDNPDGYCGYSDKKVKCPVCGSEDVVVDCVDQTNGCECEHLPKGQKCSCHERVEEIVAYTETECPECDGKKFVKIPEIYKDTPCEWCEGEEYPLPSCCNCHGQGTLRNPMSYIEIECQSCQGTGKGYIPVHDISVLIRD